MLIRGGIDHSNISTLSRSVSRTKTISNYIDSILSLIPSKQYHGNDFADVSGTHDSIDLAREGKYAKRKKNPYPEQERKESSKKGLKRARSESGFEENTEGATEGGGGGESTQTVSHSSSGISTDTQHKKVVVASSIDELRARLHARIEELRSKRGDAKKGEKEGGDSKKEERGRSAIEESKKGGDSQQLQSLMKKTSSHIPQQQQQQQKLKGSSQSQALIGAGGITGHVESGRTSSSSSATAMLSKSFQSSSHLAKKSVITASSAQTQVHRNPHGSLSSIPGQSLQTTTSAMASMSSSGKVQVPSSSSGLDVAFGQLSTSLPAALAVSTLSIKPTKASKEGRMRDQLKKAVKYKESLASLAQQGEEGVQKKISLEFNHALSRAQGEKVHDDPTLLAKALKRRKKEKSKSHADWNTRKSKEKAEMKDRQVERNKNLNNKKNRALKRGDRPAPTSSGAGSGGGGGGGGGEKEGTSSRPSPSQNRPGFEGRFGK